MKNDRQIENETLLSSLQAPDGILASHNRLAGRHMHDGILDLAVAEFPLLG